jgi:lipopolysaccharide/colanic/teichoic acid biosynthesis glycosyltransferase
MTVHYQDLVSPAAHPPVLPQRAEDPATVTPRAEGLYRRHLKRVLDVLLVLAAAPVVLPVVLVLALLVKRDGGPAFYTQPRVGRGGRTYRIWKLRTMVPDADAQLASHLAADGAAQAEWDSTQKLKADPRITRLGRILRKSSLDELPQLWNVLKGDMSLVGPRPMMVCQQPLYPGHAYYRLRPGITGPWQVSARNESSFADRARFDAGYDRDLSFATDVRLLLATVAVVLHGTGH